VKFTEAILWPFSLAYGAASHLRARAYSAGLLKSKRLDGVVISVGNLTTGGTGKTPMVLWIAEKLLAEGKRVGILTRGYQGQKIAAVEARTGTGVNTTSDEVRMMNARLGGRALFGVGANRYEGGARLAAQGVTWFVLDDGFQHQQLARDVNILLIDATNSFGGGLLLPSGRLREPLGAMARADIIVITRSSHSPALESTIHRYSEAPVFYAQPRIDSIHQIVAGQMSGGSQDRVPGNLFAFCGIGNPNGFSATLREAGITVVGHKYFPDHHRYTSSDARRILQESAAVGASGLICTEKDLYNLGGVLEGEAKVYCASISMSIGCEGEFLGQIISTASQRNSRASKT
jgi:tetraacyldisaccharide 4'-kinase